MARILMIFGPKRSQRRKLFDEKNSNERMMESNEKFPKNSKSYRKNFQKILKMDIADVINY